MAENSSIKEDVEYSSGQQEEESPILVAQRYLNIFHQIHIFSPEKRAEFDEELVNVPDKIRKIIPSIPGGRILLEYIRDVEEKRGITSNIEQEIAAAQFQKDKATGSATALTVPPAAAAIPAGGVNLGPDFAENLASSLASAFRNNNLAPDGNMHELSDALSRSFSSYANNMQQLADNVMLQNNAITQTQNQLSEQLTKQINLQTQFEEQLLATQNQQISLQDKINEQVEKQIALQDQMKNSLQEQTQWQDKMQSRFEEHLDIQNKLQSRFEEHMQLQNQLQQKFQSQMQSTSNSMGGAPTMPGQGFAAQQNTQTNNANTTTINNINVDSSCFNGLTQTLREVEEKRAADLKQVIEVLNKNFAFKDRPQGMPIEAITRSITEALKENSRQQMKAILAFGNTLSQTIRQSQKDLAETLSRNVPATEKIYITQAMPPASAVVADAPTEQVTLDVDPIAPEKTAELPPTEPKDEPKVEKEMPAEKETPKPEKKAEKKEKTPEKAEKTETVKAPEKPAEKEASKPVEKETPKPEKKAEKKEKSVEKTPKKPLTQPEPSPAAPADKEVDLAGLLDDTDDKPLTLPTTSAADEDLDFLQSFTDKQPTQSAPEVTAEPKAELNKQEIADEMLAMFGAKSAQAKSEPEAKPEISKEEIANEMLAMFSAKSDKAEPQKEPEPVSEPEPSETSPAAGTQTYDNALAQIKAALNSDEPVSLDDLDNVKPISLTETDNTTSAKEEKPADLPLDDKLLAGMLQDEPSADEAEWEYVDENGNPLPADDGEEWEYVDENGNPLPADGGEEWEYVDENGNPLPDDGSEEWEYVDENGNPLPSDGDEQWEYVDEDGNPISGDSDEQWEYVDEDGNPLPDDADGEWEYVDENGNPLADDDNIKEEKPK